MEARQVAIITGVAVSLSAIVVGVIIYSKGKSASNSSSTSSGGNATPSTSSSGGGILSKIFGGSSSSSSGGFPLAQGATGANVTAVQNYLNATNMVSPPLTVDGNLGPLTAAAVQTVGYSMPITQDEFNQMTAIYTYVPTAADNYNASPGAYSPGS